MEEYKIKYEEVFKKTEKTPVRVRIPKEVAEKLSEKYPYGFHFVGRNTIKGFDNEKDRWVYENYEGAKELVRFGEIH